MESTGPVRVIRNSRTTIRTRVAKKRLGLKPGDTVAYELADDGSVHLRKAQPLDVAYAAALGDTLSEWAGDIDQQAYADL